MYNISTYVNSWTTQSPFNLRNCTVTAPRSDTQTMCDLFVVSGANIFEEYPKVLEEIFSADKNVPKSKHLSLPSDMDYLDCVYYKMLSIQRSLNSSDGVKRWAISQEKSWDVDVSIELMSMLQIHRADSDSHANDDWNIQKIKPKDARMQFLISEVTMSFNQKRSAALYDRAWNLEDIAKATMLLRQIPINQIFLNEFDMRRIFCLVYDVYRRKMFAWAYQLNEHKRNIHELLYIFVDKQILSQVLRDIEVNNMTIVSWHSPLAYTWIYLFSILSIRFRVVWQTCNSYYFDILTWAKMQFSLFYFRIKRNSSCYGCYCSICIDGNSIVA